MLILSIDTSLPLFAVALVRDGAALAAYAAEGKASRNEKLLPAIDWILDEADVAKESLDVLCVTRGPGSFTGVRVGLATVQGLAFAIERPVCALSTHEAAMGDDDRGGVLVYSDAGRGESYASGFRDGREELAPLLVRPEELEALGARYERAIRVEELIRRENLAVRAARRVHAMTPAERAAHAETTPVYVRLAEAEAKLLRKDHG